MLPKGPLGYAMLKKMKCYAGGSSPAHRPASPRRWKSKEFRMAVTQYYGTGRRKTAIARVFLRNGSGKFIVN
jgi:hypothetical protein